MYNVFNLLLASLCVADTLFLLCNIILTPIALGRSDLFTPGEQLTPQPKREAVNAILNTQRKTASTVISPHPIDQQVSPCFNNFLTVTKSYHSKVTAIGALHTEKIAS
jgi:hypothetical protein